MQDLLNFIKQLVEEFAPALAVALWQYEESRVSKAKDDTLNAQMELELEKNHETVDSKYSGKSDADVVNDAISEGASEGQPGAGDKGTKP